jgi:hypothetical protein
MPGRRPFTGTCAHKIAGDVLRRHFTLLAETGVRILYCLGCGMNGCAFRAQDWTVLKVSAHPGEAPIARALAGRGRVWPFLPIFYGGWVIAGSVMSRRDPVGLSWREDLIDFEPAARERCHYLEASTDLVKALKRARTAEQARTARDEIFSKWAKADFSASSLSALAAIAGIGEWSLAFGLKFDLEEFAGPLAISNLGQSLELDDAIVIRDIGNFDGSTAAIRRLEQAVERKVAS